MLPALPSKLLFLNKMVYPRCVYYGSLANQFIKLALGGNGKDLDILHEAQTTYLANTYNDLSVQKERIDKIQAAKASQLAKEVAAELYLNNALRFLQNSDLALKSVVPSAGSDTGMG
ncbi:hypothetical protein DXG01_010780 [Tephrocybe rancida]|nr:hypothetical protein DXG01_010780 [Tephrocybe rancida]